MTADLDIARQRIAEEAAARTGKLDLSELRDLPCLPDQLAELRHLQRLDCYSTEVSDLTPLHALTSLQRLDCSWTQVSDLTPLQGLTSLQHLDCSSTQVSDLTPLQDLTGLQTLDCAGTQTSDLTALQGLTRLKNLGCLGSRIGDLTPLKDLTRLRYLDCAYTGVRDLTVLNKLPSLQLLFLQHCLIETWIDSLWRMPSLRAVYASGAELAGMPTDLLSVHTTKGCLPAIRAHLDDLGDAPERLTDVKLFVLGNGRIGKTQIVNRLRGAPFEEDADSTHGVSLVEAPKPGSEEGQLNIWDFGGQDIYFGTHMLFLKSRAVFMLVWTPDSDDALTHEHQGLTFRNQPVAWWLDCIRRFGHDGSQLVVVQNQLDRDRDRGDHPALVETRKNWRFCRSVAYSAATDEGRGALDDHLKHATKRFNPPLIGQGRLKLMRELQAMRDEDREREPADKRHRTLSFEAFQTLCREAGGVSDPIQFLQFLHNAGLVFWRENLFQNQVILDQAWVLDAVYTVFHRESCLGFLRRHHGRFTRSDLGLLIWDQAGYSVEEQKLFLSFMISCGICFVLREGSEDTEAEYVAPDHLPEDWEPVARQQHWGEAPPDAQANFDYPSLPPALMRNLIGRVGSEAGLACDYWRNGFYGYESETDARVLVEQRLDDQWQGSIKIQARGGRSRELVVQMERALLEEERRLGLSSERQEAERRAKDPDLEERAPSDPAFVPEPRQERSYYVSYAWEDDRSEAGKTRAQIVDAFCARAKEQGIVVQRDKDAMHLGDRISTFMKRIARGDRVIVVLSDEYLRSPFCMYELYEIWLQARGEDDRLLDRIRVFTQPCAKIWAIGDRYQYATFWNEEYAKHAGLELRLLGEKDAKRVVLMSRFASHVGDILAVVSDILQPKDLDELVSYSFDDSPSSC